MTNPHITTIPTNLGTGVLNSGESPVLPHASIDERVQRLIDKFLYGGGRSSAHKIRNFLNGTWLGEPLHVVLTDVPIGAWTVAIAFDVLDLIRARREFALAADTSIAIGLGGPHGAAAKLGLKRTTLIAIMRRLDISRPIPGDRTDVLGISREENLT